MVRRTRTDIVKYFSKDLENQGLKFPKVAKPEPLYYLLDDIYKNTPIVAFSVSVTILALLSFAFLFRFKKNIATVFCM